METKVFNGKRYTKLGRYDTKRKATSVAKEERTINHLARVTKEFTGYYVWIKKKSPYG